MLYDDYEDVKADLRNIPRVLAKHQEYIENAKIILNIKVQKDKNVVYEESAKLPSYIFYYDEPEGFYNNIQPIARIALYILHDTNTLSLQ